MTTTSTLESDLLIFVFKLAREIQKQRDNRPESSDKIGTASIERSGIDAFTKLDVLFIRLVNQLFQNLPEIENWMGLDQDKELVCFDESGLKVTNKNIYTGTNTYEMDEVVDVRREQASNPSASPILWGLHTIIAAIMIFHLVTTYQSNIVLFILALIFIGFIWVVNVVAIMGTKSSKTLVAASILGTCIILGLGVVPRIVFYLALLAGSFFLIFRSGSASFSSYKVVINTKSGNYTVGEFQKFDRADLAVTAIKLILDKRRSWKARQMQSNNPVGAD